MTQTLTIHLLGSLRIFWDNQPYPFQALPKVTPLLAYLLLQRRAPIGREELAFALWPDSTESGARSNLRRHLYDLRSALPPAPDGVEWVLTTPRTVHWNPAVAYWLDVADFEQLVQADRPAQREQALRLYTGQLLQTADEAWLSYERDRLHALYQGLLENLVSHHLAQGQYPAALTVAQRLLADDPFREEVVRTIMLIHAETGDRARALHAYHTFAQVLEAEIGVAPMPETERLAAQIRAAEQLPDGALPTPTAVAPAAASKTAIPTNLPRPLLPLIGRETELETTLRMLTAGEHPVRLLSITGPGGSGKTRLALEVAQTIYRQHAARYPDGVFLVPLATLSDHAGLLPLLAETLQFKPDPDEDLLDQLREALRYRRLLVVLDNVEQLLPAAPLLSRLLATAPGLQLVVTSQVVLNLHGEHNLALAPLAVVDPAAAPALADIRDSAAIRLFTVVAQLADPQFAIDDANALTVAAVCAQLDGLPLAIELAASQSRLLPPDVMLMQIRRSVSLLSSRARDVPERHRSLQAALQWSYALLDEAGRLLFRGLALFAGSFTPAAVGQILYATDAPAPEHIDPAVWQALQNLADHHLIHRSLVDKVEGEVRFSMLSTIRGFAGELLAQDERRDVLKRRMLAFYAHLATLQHDADLKTAATVWQDRYRVEEVNILGALAWAFAQRPEPDAVEDVAQVVLGIRSFWRFQARLEDARPWLERLLQHRDMLKGGLLVDVLCLAAHTAVMQGQFERATSLYEEAQRLAYDIEDVSLIATVLNDMGILASQAGRYEQAIDWYEKAIAIEREHNAGALTEQAAGALYNLGVAWRLSGHAERAVDLYQEFLAYARHHEMPSHVALGTISLSNAYWSLDQPARSLALLIEGLMLALDGGDEYIMLVGISAAAEHAMRGDLNALSVKLHSTLRSQYLARNYVLPRYVQEDMARDLAQLEERLGADAFIRAQRQGNRMKPATAVQEALAGLQSLGG